MFVWGRQIFDVVLIANEAIDSLMRRKGEGILCKLDIFMIMEKMGFDRKWLNWIRCCISTTFSSLINGFFGFFLKLQGLGLGDPLSLLSFCVSDGGIALPYQ